MENIFEFNAYRPYLLQRLGGKGRRTGSRMAAAKAMGCHTSFLSQVTNQESHISLEQAWKLNEYFEHPKVESEYFLLMVQKERSGTQELANHFLHKMKELQREKFKIKDRLKDKDEISENDMAQFYSTWLYGAIHILSSIPGKQSAHKMAEHLNMPMSQMMEMLEFLISIGLVLQEGNRYVMGPKHIHLGSENLFIKAHHKNWRHKTLNELETGKNQGMHYSAAISLSQSDVQKVKESLMRSLQQNVAVIEKSKPEKLFCYSFDFFEI